MNNHDEDANDIEDTYGGKISCGGANCIIEGYFYTYYTYRSSRVFTTPFSMPKIPTK